MTSPFGPLAALADVSAARGRVGEELDELERQLQARRLEYRIVRLEGPEAAAGAVRDALERGERFLVAVGGDALIHRIVNALVEDDRPVDPEAVLGVVGAGSAPDFVRTFGLPPDVIKATRYLMGESTYPIDVVKVACDGATRYFANLAEVGMGAGMIRRASRLPGFLGRGRTFLGFWTSLLRSPRREIRVRTDRRSFAARATGAVIGNCQYGREGMRLSPRSYPGDGSAEVLVAVGPRSDAFTLIPKFFRGEHVPSDSFKELKGTTIHVDADRPLPVAADGEYLGTTPATFTVIPEALRIKV